MFAEILEDEAFHMNYTDAQLARVAPPATGAALWRARASRLWKGYLRVATALAGVIGAADADASSTSSCCRLFALLAKRAERREARRAGTRARPGATPRALESPY